MTLSLVSFPPFSRSLARDMTSGRWSLPLPGDSELYLIPVVILAKNGQSSAFPPKPLMKSHRCGGWTQNVDVPDNIICPRSTPKMRILQASENWAHCGAGTVSPRTVCPVWWHETGSDNSFFQMVKCVFESGDGSSRPRVPRWRRSTCSAPLFCSSRWPLSS